MNTEAGLGPAPNRAGVFRRRLAWVFLGQFVVVALAGVADATGVLPLPLVLALMAVATWLAWLAASRQWQPVSTLARWVHEWRDGHPGAPTVGLAAHVDADVAALAHGLQGFAERLADYGVRERNFTRDASHELRTPLTVIRMGVDMLADEPGLGEAGQRSVRRIHRATRELEALVEVLLILARESDPGCTIERFAVNTVLRRELETARELMAGLPLELVLEEFARFDLQGSVRAFSVLCWQLIRDACQHAGAGCVRVAVHEAAICVSHESNHAVAGGEERHSFELAIAQRISDRFGWSLALQAPPGQSGGVCVRFPDALPATD